MEYRRGRITREYRRWDGMACAVSDKTTRVFGYAKDALATDDRVNLISDQRQQPRSVLTAGWRIDDGIHQSAAVVAQRGVRRREQEGIIANVALCGRKRLPHQW